MIEILITLVSNYRWALVVLLFNVLMHYLSPQFPELTENPELQESIKTVIEWILVVLFGLLLRLPRKTAEDQDIQSAWQLFKDTLKNGKHQPAE